MTVYIETNIGDALDRLTILLLKSFYIKEPGSLGNIIKEISGIVPGLSSLDKGQWKSIDVYLSELYDTNKILWNQEELLRKVLANSIDNISKEKLSLMINVIHEMNLKRADLKKIINKQFETDFLEMKDYKTTIT